MLFSRGCGPMNPVGNRARLCVELSRIQNDLSNNEACCGISLYGHCVRGVVCFTVDPDHWLSRWTNVCPEGRQPLLFVEGVA